jgi:hypothetical protein
MRKNAGRKEAKKERKKEKKKERKKKKEKERKKESGGSKACGYEETNVCNCTELQDYVVTEA